MPETACNKCVEQLVKWELFYETCHRSEDRLKQASNNLKNEINFISVENHSECSSDSESDNEDYFPDDFLDLYVKSYQVILNKVIKYFSLAERSRLQV